MEIIFVKFSALALKASFVLLVLAAAPAFAPEAVGDWTGLPAGQLHIIVHITGSTDGLYSGSLESPDQGAFVLPMDNIEVTPGHLAFSIPKIGGSYDGKWNAGTESWVGTWHQRQYVAFNLTRLDSKTLNQLKAKHPQEEAVTAVPLPYQQHEVTFDSSSAASSTRLMDHITVKLMGTTGSPVFLIPGLSSPRAVWDGIAPELAKSHRAYLVQVNGFGGDAPGANLNPGKVRHSRKPDEKSTRMV
jgi:hypothetical protein